MGDIYCVVSSFAWIGVFTVLWFFHIDVISSKYHNGVNKDYNLLSSYVLNRRAFW